ncbi:B3 domain-containing protein Os01g0723500-like [Rhodamnia argentea]|uniref:B3 domain-containing protein Os01g0723500-like n=1 Tax=Rhodamnia argentea TaxID=178133 RepID=A0A8B8NLY7_9MYRT|nr:B3 domain-containing protein Os01g0723500-like [Rhodamnia argentea]
MEALRTEHELGSIRKMKMNSFFKLILQREPMQGLKIPPKFARLFSEELPCRLILKGPSGENWNAKLCKNVTGLYIHDGWREFHIDNSLGNKEFLLFQYDGKRSFEVHIYDPTGLERINVPVTKGKETNFHSWKSPRGRPRKCPVCSGNLPQSTYFNSQEGQNQEVELNKLEIINREEEEMDLCAVRMSSEPRKHKRRNKLGKLTAGLSVSKSTFRCHSIEKQKNASHFEVNARVRAIEEMLTSTFPYFMTYMKMFSLRQAKMLYIPRAFAQVHMPREWEDVVLRNLEGNTWNVVCLENDNRRFFSGGWSAFIEDNKLATGDVCLFERLSNKEFLVTIFQSPETLTA